MYFAAITGWFGETIQFSLTVSKNVNKKYDRDVLLAIALVQSGAGEARFTNHGTIELKTENKNIELCADDYRNENFGSFYYDNSDSVLSLSTRRYLRQFKEEYLGISDPSRTSRFLDISKKSTITLK